MGNLDTWDLWETERIENLNAPRAGVIDPDLFPTYRAGFGCDQESGQDDRI